MNYPYILLNKKICLENIQRMALKAKKNNIKFRPHFKTHQSTEIGEWYRNAGVGACTVSSFQMADYFALAGWNDITVAFPVSPFDSEIINRIAPEIELNIVFSSYKNLNSVESTIQSKVGVYIELDCGHDRSGVSPNNTREIALMVNQMVQNPYYTFRGFITHAGQTYGARTKEEVIAIHRKTLTLLTQIKSFWKESYPNISISYGDTPSCSISEEFWAIDEIRPGNFVFYDVTQTLIGSCNTDDIAIALICPVVDVYPERGEAIIRGGAVHLSKDSIINSDNSKSFGLVCPFDGTSWGSPIDGLYIKSISQEHGVVASSNSEQIAKLKPGQLLAILPVHSCLTVDIMGEIYQSDGTSIPTMRKRV